MPTARSCGQSANSREFSRPPPSPGIPTILPSCQAEASSNWIGGTGARHGRPMEPKFRESCPCFKENGRPTAARNSENVFPSLGGIREYVPAPDEVPMVWIRRLLGCSPASEVRLQGSFAFLEIPRITAPAPGLRIGPHHLPTGSVCPLGSSLRRRQNATKLDTGEPVARQVG